MLDESPKIPLFVKRQLPPMRHRFLSVAGRQMHVMDRGKGRPVLMVHGNPTWGFLYREVISALLDDEKGRSLHLVAPDLIGLGYSEKPQHNEVHTLRNHSLFLKSLVQQLDLHDVILVFQDWGGPICLHAFAEMRERIGAMVVLNTAVGPPKQPFNPTLFHRFAQTSVAAPLMFRGFGFPQLNLNLVQGDKRSIRRNAARAYRAPLAGLANNRAPLAMARMVPDSHAHPSITPLKETLDVFQSFSGPIRMVWGDNDPILGGVRTYLERLKPDAKVVRTSAGHFLQEEVPDEIAAAILDV
ncbi:MAG: alpha/beta fold hydrolase [Deltaproteobacteria bacterium]|nr:alpha/beta fold hydrolase [Deltaproteobacteria bacterium]